MSKTSWTTIFLATFLVSQNCAVVWAQTPAKTMAVVFAHKGKTTLFGSQTVETGQAVHEHDRLSTTGDAKLKLYLMTESVVALGSDTQLSVSQVECKTNSACTIGLSLYRGTLRVSQDAQNNTRFSVQSNPQQAFRIQGSSFCLQQRAHLTLIALDALTLSKGQNQRFHLAALSKMRLDGSSSSKVKPLTDKLRKALYQETEVLSHPENLAWHLVPDKLVPGSIQHLLEGAPTSYEMNLTESHNKTELDPTQPSDIDLGTDGPFPDENQNDDGDVGTGGNLSNTRFGANLEAQEANDLEDGEWTDYLHGTWDPALELDTEGFIGPFRLIVNIHHSQR